MKKILLITCLTTLSFFIFSCKNRESRVEPEENHNPTTISVDEEFGKINSSESAQENLSGKVQIISEDEFIAKITDITNPKGFQYKGQTPCIVDFYADWCAPCIRMMPLLDSIAAEYNGRIIVYKINVDKAQNVAYKLNITTIPALFFFKKNAQPVGMTGMPSRTELENAIKDVLLN